MMKKLYTSTALTLCILAMPLTASANKLSWGEKAAIGAAAVGVVKSYADSAKAEEAAQAEQEKKAAEAKAQQEKKVKTAKSQNTSQDSKILEASGIFGYKLGDKFNLADCAKPKKPEEIVCSISNKGNKLFHEANVVFNPDTMEIVMVTGLTKKQFTVDANYMRQIQEPEMFRSPIPIKPVWSDWCHEEIAVVAQGMKNRSIAQENDPDKEMRRMAGIPAWFGAGSKYRIEATCEPDKAFQNEHLTKTLPLFKSRPTNVELHIQYEDKEGVKKAIKRASERYKEIKSNKASERASGNL